MADRKPLPALPTAEYSPNLVRLSTPAREHRARFIRFVLSELFNESDRNVDLEEWENVLEDVLDDLGNSLVQGKWLSGIKRGKAEKRERGRQKRHDSETGSAIANAKDSEEIQDAVSILSSVASETPFSNEERLEQLRQLLAEPDVLSPALQSKHLLLCLAPLGIQIQESGFDIVPASFGCSFRSGSFVLPDHSDSLDSILYGFQEWDASTPRFVGGTFILRGVSFPQHYHVFAKVLKLSIYVHLSLLLEQQLLLNHHVPLTFPRPRVRVHTHSSSNGSSHPISPSSSHEHKASISSNSSNKSRSRTSLIPNGIISFFSKRNLRRTTSFRDGPVRSSLDLVIPFPSSGEESPVRSSMDEVGNRFRRFSFLSPPPSQLQSPQEIPTSSTPFSATLSRIEAQKNVLSTSAGVSFDPPLLLVRLSEKEKAHPDSKILLMGDERAALNSLLGWGAVEPEGQTNGSDPEKDRGRKGRNMAGICGFLNQQEISILVSTRIPVPGISHDSSGASTEPTPAPNLLPVPSREASSSSQTSDSSDSSTRAVSPILKSTTATTQTHTSCEQPHWMLYRYYLESGTHKYQDACAEDQSLGDVVTTWIDEADVPCSRFRPVPDPPKGGIGRMVGSVPTKQKRCEVTMGKHEKRFIHGGVKISVEIDWPDPLSLSGSPAKSGTDVEKVSSTITGFDATLETRVIKAWESCSICGAQTEKTQLSDGAYLFSFAKYLELLIYSPLICVLSPKLCEHIPSSLSANLSSQSLPPERFNIVRHFATVSLNEQSGGVGAGAGTIPKEYTVSFKTEPIEDIFELRVPRLQIAPRGDGNKGNAVVSVSRTSLVSKGEESDSHRESKDEEDKKKLRREIKAWWEGVADHMEALEDMFSSEDQVSIKKALPRLPSTDDAYDSFDDEEPEAHPTPKAKISGLPESSTPMVMAASRDYFQSKTVQNNSSPNSSHSSTPPAAENLTPTPSRALHSAASAASLNSELTVATTLSSAGTSSSASSVHSTNDAPPVDPMELLSNLRQTFHRTEQTLYTQLSKTPSSSLNDVRRAFLSAARGAERRLIAWQKKHIGGKKKKSKSKDREGELNPSEKLRAAEPEWWNKACHVVPGGNIIIREDDWGSIIAFTLSVPEYHRELASMSVTRTGSTSDLQPEPPNSPMMTPSTSASSFFSAATATGYKLFRTSALVQPDPDQEDVIWHEPEAYSAVISRKEHPRDPTSLLSIREVLRHKSPDSNILSGSRFASLGSSTSKLLNGGGGRPSMLAAVPPSAWAKPDVQVSKHEAEGEVASGLTEGSGSIHQMLTGLEAVEAGDTESRPGSSLAGSYPWSTSEVSTIKRNRAPSAMTDATLGQDDAASIADSGVNSKGSPPLAATPVNPAHVDTSVINAKTSLSSLTSGITNAMRLVLPTSSIPRPLSAGSNRHHGLLSAEANLIAIDERPHIKYDWTIGKRLKFSCTVYYAKQFDNLRKRCGVDSNFLESLSRSMNWSADGGKSKSNFWKTSDDRFIIKTLVNAWNVADLQVLIELGPSYFRYMDSTASKATVLAKLLGFYTIEIRNLETGAVQSKGDLLVMENLFYDQKIDKTFDLKGIQGRKVKAGNNATGQTSKTLFDGEWVEGQQQTLTFVRPHSKAVLREAIKGDADFLSKSNIMDYSLLLGVDTEHKQMTCGLVDTIGSYTFAKTLEYKAKQGLNSGSGKEVTVMPPVEYQERFLNSLEKYFVACPDKWSRPIDEPKLVSNLNQLPSVL
ncbi:hypothetical protein GYMLUDRAFT_41376 [Collybiopsis luxurians FD-317 M1]|uniref:PIPK domain-containing protein n=1 Tax=Collybiopsis luxurians FD-317 M1 TaxID=944289 RepID=A0A0D0BGP3_9AGAR|nr:hypothetical protein GYMLUDRAFT_41376 [Collybiopsis luxurians FD-317 M1]